MRLYHKIEDWGDIVRWLQSLSKYNGIDWDAGGEDVDGVSVYWIDFYDHKVYNLAVMKWKL